MAEVTIYHNPRCSKSRQTLELLRAHGVDPEIIEYLKDPPTIATLKRLASKLGVSPQEMVRTKELAKLELPKAPNAQQSLRIMADHPQTIERPIVVCGNLARVGRPPENVLDLLS